MTFDSFIGNEKVVERLRKKLRDGRFPHGLIFSGPEGVGKHTFAVMLAKALNCLHAAAGDFCDECSSCRKIGAGTHPDVTTITLEEEATRIKISQARQLLNVLQLQPLEGRNKVFIIDPANLLNDEASNALLKGLEEPPENTFIILITVNVHELLLTVRSRCQVYNFTPLTLDQIRRHGVTEELAVRWSQGSIGKARSLDIEHIQRERETVLDFLETVIRAKEEEFQDLLGVSADMGRAKLDFESRMLVLAVLIADLLYLQEGAAEKIMNVDIRDRLQALSARVSVERLLQMAEFLKVLEQNLKSHVNKQMLMDALSIIANESATARLA